MSYFSLKNPKKGYEQNDEEHFNNLNSAQNLANKKFEMQIESIDSILISKFNFFNSFTISPYTFNSFFV